MLLRQLDAGDWVLRAVEHDLQVLLDLRIDLGGDRQREARRRLTHRGLGALLIARRKIGDRLVIAVDANLSGALRGQPRHHREQGLRVLIAAGHPGGRRGRRCGWRGRRCRRRLAGSLTRQRGCRGDRQCGGAEEHVSMELHGHTVCPTRWGFVMTRDGLECVPPPFQFRPVAGARIHLPAACWKPPCRVSASARHFLRATLFSRAIGLGDRHKMGTCATPQAGRSPRWPFRPG